MYYHYPTEFGYFGVWSGADVRTEDWTEYERFSDFDKPLVMPGAGMWDTNRFSVENQNANRSIEAFEAKMDSYGLAHKGTNTVPGAHNWETWQQLLNIFGTQHLWRNEVESGRLAGLELMDPAGTVYDLQFAPDKTNYEIVIPSDIEGVLFTPTASGADDVVTITSDYSGSGDAVEPYSIGGEPTGGSTVRVRPGSNVTRDDFKGGTVTATVTVENAGARTEYTVVMHREDASPYFEKFEQREYENRFWDIPTSYWIYLPDDMEPGEDLPVVVALHGGGESYNENVENHNMDAMLIGNHLMTSWVKDSEEDGKRAIVIAPQAISSTDNGDFVWNTRNSSRWYLDESFQSGSQRSYYERDYIELYQNGHIIHDLLMDIVDEYADYVDSDRLYLTGLSMGAMDSVALLAEYPETFAGALLFAGHGALNDEQVANMGGINVRFIVDDEDRNSADSYRAPQTVAKLQAVGANADVLVYDRTTKPYIYPSAHNATWIQGLDQYLESDGMYVRDWLFSQSNAATAPPVTPPSGGSSGGTRSSGGNGGQSGGSSGTSSWISGALAGAVTGTAADITETAALSALSSALSSGASTVRFQNPGTISLSALQAMAAQLGETAMTIHADSMNGGAVDVRLYVNPALASRDINLAASTVNARASGIKALFGNWFSNNVMVVSLEQSGVFGQTVRVAVKLAPELAASEQLVIYSYNSTGNTYSKAADQGYRVDANGYVHFNVTAGGDYVISAGELARK